MIVMLLLFLVIVAILVAVFSPVFPQLGLSIRYAGLTGDWLSVINGGQRSRRTTIRGPEFVWRELKENEETKYSQTDIINWEKFVIGSCGDLVLKSCYVDPCHAIVIQRIEDGERRFYLRNLSRINPTSYRDHDTRVYLALEYHEEYPLEPGRTEKFMIGNFRLKIVAPAAVTSDSEPISRFTAASESRSVHSSNYNTSWSPQKISRNVERYDGVSNDDEDDFGTPEPPCL